MDAATEAQLVTRFRAGDREEREALFDDVLAALGKGLELLCRRMLGNAADAEDALQDALLAIYRALPAYRGEARLSTWAYRITVRAALARRARVRRSAHAVSTDEPAAEPIAEPVDGAAPSPEALHEREMALAFDRAVASLRPSYRAVFSLCSLDELSSADVARILGIPEGTVWTRLHRARKELAAGLKEWLAEA